MASPGGPSPIPIVAIEGLEDLFATLGETVTDLSDAFAELAGSLTETMEEMSGGAQQTEAANISSIASILKVKLAFDLVEGTIRQTVASLEKYGAALSPATLDLYHQSLRNLDATIGQAVLPIFQVLATSVARFSGIIDPIAQALAPVFEELTRVASSIVLDFARLGASLITGLMPVFELVASILETALGAIAPIFQIIAQVGGMLGSVFGLLLSVSAALFTPLQIVVQVIGELINAALVPFTFAVQAGMLAFLPLRMILDAVREAMAAIHEPVRALQIVFDALYSALKDVLIASLAPFKDGLKSAVDTVKSAFQTASKEIILFAARVAALFGAVGVINALIKQIGVEGQEVGKVAAPQNVGIKDFAAIARDMQIAAFAAGPGGERDKTERDYLKEILPLLRELRDNPKSVQTVVENGFKEVQKILTKLLTDTFGQDLADKIIRAIVDGFRNRP